MKCVKCTVSGRVQGVFFRASTAQQAHKLGLSGYARNLPDGCVEVLACGAAAKVEQLHDWLWQGPSAARVSKVNCHEVTETAPPGFTTG